MPIIPPLAGGARSVRPMSGFQRWRLDVVRTDAFSEQDDDLCIKLVASRPVARAESEIGRGLMTASGTRAFGTACLFWCRPQQAFRSE
jgi:hypothetical protein